MIFAFGHSERERVAIDILSYERAVSGEFYDDNWLVVAITVSAGGFSGRARASILTDELVRFREQLRRLYDSLSGAAEFSALEGQLSLMLTGDGRGHVRLAGDVPDQAGIGNRLSFTLDLDQTLLKDSIHELDAVLQAFPARGAKA